MKMSMKKRFAQKARAAKRRLDEFYAAAKGGCKLSEFFGERYSVPNNLRSLTQVAW